MKIASFALVIACTSAMVQAAVLENDSSSDEAFCPVFGGAEPLHAEKYPILAQIEDDDEDSYIDGKYFRERAIVAEDEELTAENVWGRAQNVENYLARFNDKQVVQEEEGALLRDVEKALGRPCPGKCLRLGEKYLDAKYRFEQCLKERECNKKKDCDKWGGQGVSYGKSLRGFAAPFNTRGARWGSCGPTTPFAEYRYIVANISVKHVGRINNNPNDDIMCKRPFFIEVLNVATGKWIKAKVAGACYNCRENDIQLSEKAYQLIGGFYGKHDRTPVKWRFAIDK